VIDKWARRWLEHAQLHASFSKCGRGRVGAWIIDPTTNAPLSAGYNGPPRGKDWDKCGGDVCTRDVQRIPSGTATEIGCEHAEANAVANADGRSLRGAVAVISTPPCLACAKLLKRHGICEVHFPRVGSYPDGKAFLEQVGVLCVEHDLT
jgi:dCMP deaminase